MMKVRNLPDLNRLSLVAAAILLAYPLARLIRLPARELSVQLPGFYLNFSLDAHLLTALIVAGLTAAGAEWLLSDHPRIGRRTSPEHWLLPALTAWVIEIPLITLSIGAIWWLGFGLGGGLLVLVLVAEYIVVDPDDIRQGPAAAILTAISYALFLALATTLRYASFRLFMALPVITFAIGLVSLRTLHLRLHGRWAMMEAGAIAFATAQIAAALHYWPLSPVGYALALLGPAYALTSLTAALQEGTAPRQALIEPLFVLGLIWGAAVVIR
jgi:hypothetical protein